MNGRTRDSAMTRAQVAAQRIELGNRLAKRREHKGINQKEFAERVFYDRTSITKIEAGRQSAPQAFWCEADRVLDADGELVAAFYALAATKETVLAAHPYEVLAYRSTSALAEHINTAIELRALSAALMEHTRHALMDEPVDWAGIIDKLDRAANACRRHLVIHPVSST